MRQKFYAKLRANASLTAATGGEVTKMHDPAGELSVRQGTGRVGLRGDQL
ncbi:MAG TPA: hypothetical protein VES67_07360 [Vicinamibacterales bacterium]|nr:hypothetical protein [Vicinamibacterales bacterium]